MNKEKIKSKCKNIEDKIIRYRRKFHRKPELKYQEKETSKFIKEELQKIGIEVKESFLDIKSIEKELKSTGEEQIENVGDTSVVGILEGENNNSSRTVALRADMDALPISESDSSDHLPDTKEFRSVNNGVMHACGHDGHMAMLLGAAKIFSENKEKIDGKIKLVFQPGEEGGNGAKLLSQTNLLDDVDAIFGIHVWSDLRSGKIKVNDGPMMAAVDRIKLEITGGGGHGSAPHEAKDPLFVSTKLINSLYEMINREISTLKPSVLSITRLNSGDTWNVIPAKSELEGTVRTFDKDVRKKILNRIQEKGESITDLHGLDFNLQVNHLGPATINYSEEAGIVRDTAINLFGENEVKQGDPDMGSEDFAYYLKEIPGAFAFLGTGNKEKGTMKPHHNPEFDLDEIVLHKGVALLVGTGLEYLKK